MSEAEAPGPDAESRAESAVVDWLAGGYHGLPPVRERRQEEAAGTEQSSGRADPEAARQRMEAEAALRRVAERAAEAAREELGANNKQLALMSQGVVRLEQENERLERENAELRRRVAELEARVADGRETRDRT